MLDRWKFIKDRRGSWRCYYTEADGSISPSASSFPNHGVCMADAKRNGWKWLPTQRKRRVVPIAKK